MVNDDGTKVINARLRLSSNERVFGCKLKWGQ
jgi:hypothetical protein